MSGWSSDEMAEIRNSIDEGHLERVVRGMEAAKKMLGTMGDVGKDRTGGTEDAAGPTRFGRQMARVWLPFHPLCRPTFGTGYSLFGNADAATDPEIT